MARNEAPGSKAGKPGGEFRKSVLARMPIEATSRRTTVESETN
jgi:hypothetical protein